MLHDDFGGQEYWSVRRSMRFADYLRVEAQKFRREVLNSDDIRDQTQVKEDWRDTKVSHMMKSLTHISEGNYKWGLMCVIMMIIVLILHISVLLLL